MLQNKTLLNNPEVMFELANIGTTIIILEELFEIYNPIPLILNTP